MNDDIVFRLRKRAEIRRTAKGRKSVQLNQADRLADLLEEAAKEIEALQFLLEDEKNYSEEIRQNLY